MSAIPGRPKWVEIVDRGQSWTAYRVDGVGSVRLADLPTKGAAWRFAISCLQDDLPVLWNGQHVDITQARREARA